jgi:hypothetical protein
MTHKIMQNDSVRTCDRPPKYDCERLKGALNVVLRSSHNPEPQLNQRERVQQQAHCDFTAILSSPTAGS